MPSGLQETPVHLDPSFAGHLGCDTHTYGDEHAVKAVPLSKLNAGDFVWFYASLEPVDGGPCWSPPEWGAFIIGQFRLAVDPIDPAKLGSYPDAIVQRCERNAHFRRSNPDAAVVLLGDDDASGLLVPPIPLSTSEVGSKANEIVTELAGDSGRGPWLRRVLRFDEAATKQMRLAIDRGEISPAAIVDSTGTIEHDKR